MKTIPRILLIFSSLLPLPGLAETAVVPAAILRYEEALLRRPEAGPAFDRVVGHFRTGPGLEALEERWIARYESAANMEQKAGWATLAGLLAQDQEDIGGAAEWLEKALEADPDQVKTRIALGEMLANKGDFDSATLVLREGLDPERLADPDQSELHRQLALTLERDFQTEEAVSIWKRLAAQPDADTFTLEEAAEALARNQDFAAAQEIFARLAELTVEDPYQNVRFQIRLARLKEAEG